MSIAASGKSATLQNTLRGKGLHEEWETSYRTPENVRFYTLVFDYLKERLNPGPDTVILDAGCGPCEHSILLAERGFRVMAVDFSESALDMARANVAANKLQDAITVRQETLLALSFKDRTFDYVFCWGVLMHIPEVKTAVSELCRVLKQNGRIIIGEVNMYSFEIVVLRFLKRLFSLIKPSRVKIEPIDVGIENWKPTASGTLLYRQLNFPKAIRYFEGLGLTLETRTAGQFSELYAKRLPGFVKRIIHGFNECWFRFIRIPHLATGNVLIFRKEA